MCLCLQWTNRAFVDVSVFLGSFACMFHLAVKALIFLFVWLFMCLSDLLDRVVLNALASKVLNRAAELTVIRI